MLLTVGINAGGLAAKNLLKSILKSDLISTIGKDCTEKLLKQFDDVKDLSKYVKRILKMGLDSGVIIEVSEKFGREGLEWIISKQGKGLTNDLVRKMLKADSLDVFTDSVLYAIKSSANHADDIIEQVIKHGQDAATFIVKYGDVATEALIKYGDDALEVLTDYGDDAAEGFKNGKTPDEIRAGIESGSKTGLTQAQIDEILALPKGSRPDPSTYLSQEYISAHLAQFDDGAAYILSESDYDLYYRGVPEIARNDGTLFVTSQNYLNEVLQEADGDLAYIEQALGYPEGMLEDGNYKIISIDNPSNYRISIPSGNEAGANSEWIPGGYTSGGIPEAVVYNVPNNQNAINIHTVVLERK